MPYLGSWKIDDYVTFYCNTHDPDTGVATDADAVPTYRIYEDETATPIVTGSMALLDSANTAGFYSERVQLTAANGYEKGKTYCIYITATVDSDEGTTHHMFQMEAEVDANTVSALHADWVDAGRLDVLIDAIKAKTDNLPADPADDSDIDSQLATIDTVVDAIKAVTDNLPDSGALNALAAILADSNELQTDWVNGGRLDLLIDAIKAVTDNLPDSGALNDLALILADTGTDGVVLAAGAITAAKIATDAITSDELATSALQEIADEVLKRGVDNVEATADVDSLAAVILAMLHSSIVGTTWTIKKTDDSSTFDTKDLTTDSGADPVTAVADP